MHEARLLVKQLHIKQLLVNLIITYSQTEDYMKYLRSWLMLVALIISLSVSAEDAKRQFIQLVRKHHIWGRRQIYHWYEAGEDR